MAQLEWRSKGHENVVMRNPKMKVTKCNRIVMLSGNDDDATTQQSTNNSSARAGWMATGEIPKKCLTKTIFSAKGELRKKETQERQVHREEKHPQEVQKLRGEETESQQSARTSPPPLGKLWE